MSDTKPETTNQADELPGGIKLEPVTTDLPDIAKAAYILDHGWEFIEPKNQEENRAPHRYKTWQRPFLEGVNLETAYAMQKAQEDEIGDKCPLEEAKKLVARWK